MLCNNCLKYDKLHDVIPYKEYLTFLMQMVNTSFSTNPFDPQYQRIIDGNNLQSKMDIFFGHLKADKEQLKTEHIETIHKILDNFVETIQRRINTLKDSIIASYLTKLDQIMSQESLRNRAYKNRAAKLILTNLKNDYSLFNSSLIKLHEGKYESIFSKEHCIQIFTRLKSQLENLINQQLDTISGKMDDFQKIFTDFDAKEKRKIDKAFQNLKITNILAGAQHLKPTVALDSLASPKTSKSTQQMQNTARALKTETSETTANKYGKYFFSGDTFHAFLNKNSMPPIQVARKQTEGLTSPKQTAQ